MLTFCQRQFEENNVGHARLLELKAELSKAANEEEKRDAEINLEEFKNIQKARYLGNISLISELWKIGQLSMDIIQCCIAQLLEDPDDEQLESLCRMLNDIGPLFEETVKKPEYKEVNTWWRQGCLALLHKHAEEFPTKRIRFFVQDVLNARKVRVF